MQVEKDPKCRAKCIYLCAVRAFGVVGLKLETRPGQGSVFGETILIDKCGCLASCRRKSGRGSGSEYRTVWNGNRRVRIHRASDHDYLIQFTVK